MAHLILDRLPSGRGEPIASDQTTRAGDSDKGLWSSLGIRSFSVRLCLRDKWTSAQSVSTRIGRCGTVAQPLALRTCCPGERGFEAVVAPKQFVANGEGRRAKDTLHSGFCRLYL
jgi:hypothetical protein